MVKADLYFLSLLLKNYKGHSIRFHLSNSSDFVGTVGDLSKDNGLIELIDVSVGKRFIPLCDIVALESTNSLPIVLPHRSRKCYVEVDTNLGSCSRALNIKAFELWRSQTNVSIFVIGHNVTNTRILDVVPGIISANNSVFVAAHVAELQVPNVNPTVPV